jgi:large subunit ribosomal protein L18
MKTNLDRRTRIKAHIRHKVSGTAQKPRMTVFRSNTQIYAQLIDDVNE